jgi:hypothetical protein
VLVITALPGATPGAESEGSFGSIVIVQVPAGTEDIYVIITVLVEVIPGVGDCGFTQLQSS